MKLYQQAFAASLETTKTNRFFLSIKRPLAYRRNASSYYETWVGTKKNPGHLRNRDTHINSLF